MNYPVTIFYKHNQLIFRTCWVVLYTDKIKVYYDEDGLGSVEISIKEFLNIKKNFNSKNDRKFLKHLNNFPEYLV